MRNIWNNKMKKQLSKETIVKMNEKFWEEGFSPYCVARAFRSSLPVVQRTLTHTRAEYHKIKQDLFG